MRERDRFPKVFLACPFNLEYPQSELEKRGYVVVQDRKNNLEVNTIESITSDLIDAVMWCKKFIYVDVENVGVWNKVMLGAALAGGKKIICIRSIYCKDPLDPILNLPQVKVYSDWDEMFSVEFPLQRIHVKRMWMNCRSEIRRLESKPLNTKYKVRRLKYLKRREVKLFNEMGERFGG
jgi:hypothetical protein